MAADEHEPIGWKANSHLFPYSITIMGGRQNLKRTTLNLYPNTSVVANVEMIRNLANKYVATISSNNNRVWSDGDHDISVRRGVSINFEHSNSRVDMPTGFEPFQKILRPEELGDTFRGGILVEFPRSTILLQDAIKDHCGPIRQDYRFLLIMGYKNCSNFQFALKTKNKFTHLVPKMRIEVRQRFVQQKQARLDNEGSGQRHPLLLSTRQLGGSPILVTQQMNHV